MSKARIVDFPYGTRFPFNVGKLKLGGKGIAFPRGVPTCHGKRPVQAFCYPRSSRGRYPRKERLVGEVGGFALWSLRTSRTRLWKKVDGPRARIAEDGSVPSRADGQGDIGPPPFVAGARARSAKGWVWQRHRASDQGRISTTGTPWRVIGGRECRTDGSPMGIETPETPVEPAMSVRTSTHPMKIVRTHEPDHPKAVGWS